MFHRFGIFRHSPPEGSPLQSWLKTQILYLGTQQSQSDPARLFQSVSAGHLEDRLSGFAQRVSLSLLVLYHFLGDVLLLAQGRLLLSPLAPGLHPGYQAEHSSANDRGDARQVEGHVVAAQSVPQEACKQRRGGGRNRGVIMIPTGVRKRATSTHQEKRLLYDTLRSQVNTELTGACEGQK